MDIKAWISAFRLRTLPLALAGIGAGGFLAFRAGVFRYEILIMSLLTATLLQILSNLANDYGDTVNGADHAERQGPSRAVQSGAISLGDMKKAAGIFGLLALLSGIILLWLAFGGATAGFWGFLGIGLLALVAAVTYTAGSKPYGYAGLGDISVLIFFGPVSTAGSFFLHGLGFMPSVLLPALSVGFFSVAVLNVNNIRDIESDRTAGKRSIPVRIGKEKAMLYHAFLLSSGLACTAVYFWANYQSPIQWLFLLSLPVFLRTYAGIAGAASPAQVDPYLKQTALGTVFFVLLFGIGLLS